jgi:hypothetical protein
MLSRWFDQTRKRKHWRFRTALSLLGLGLVAWSYFGGSMAPFWVALGLLGTMQIAYWRSDQRMMREQRAQSLHRPDSN